MGRPRPAATAAVRFAAAALAVLVAAGCAAGRELSPRFTIRRRDLPQLLALLPPAVAARVEAGPARFLELAAGALAAPAGTLLLVDKDNPLDPAFVPDDLVDLAGRGLALAKDGLRLRGVVLDDLAAMSRAASDEGVTLVVASTYRSFAQQRDLRRRALATQPRELVDRELAVEGHSQHQLGTVVDFGSIDDSFAATDAGRWMAARAAEYGWSLSYPQGAEDETGYRWESWHFRWIGRPAAALVGEFFGGSQQAFLSFWSMHADWLGARLRAGA
jgi:D-alanyl-D-alanine carboxypeptidase